MNGLVQIFSDIRRHCHIGTQELKGACKAIHLSIVGEAFFTDATVGFRHGDILIELVAVLVFHNDFHWEWTGTDTNGLDGDEHILLDDNITITITIVFGINTEILRTRQQGLVHQQLASLVNITQIGQRWHTSLRIAIGFKRAVRLFVIIVSAIVLTGEVDMYATIW